MSHFKSQQEIWKYVADGGAVVNAYGEIIRFINGDLSYANTLSIHQSWSPYIEHIPKTKVWRWERVEADSCGNKSIFQYPSLFTEETAADLLPGYTKVAGSEREI